MKDYSCANWYKSDKRIESHKENWKTNSSRWEIDSSFRNLIKRIESSNILEVNEEIKEKNLIKRIESYYDGFDEHFKR